MRFLLAMVCFFNFSAFAAKPTPAQVIQDLEYEKNVKCQFIKKDSGLCVGPSYTSSVCRYSKIYACAGDKTLNVTLKIRESYNQRSGQREEKVLKVEY